MGKLDILVKIKGEVDWTGLVSLAGISVLTGKSEDGAVSGGLAGDGFEGFRVAREHVEDGQQTRDALSRLDHFRQNVTTVLLKERRTDT